MPEVTLDDTIAWIRASRNDPARRPEIVARVSALPAADAAIVIRAAIWSEDGHLEREDGWDVFLHRGLLLAVRCLTASAERDPELARAVARGWTLALLTTPAFGDWTTSSVPNILADVVRLDDSVVGGLIEAASDPGLTSSRLFHALSSLIDRPEVAAFFQKQARSGPQFSTMHSLPSSTWRTWFRDDESIRQKARRLAMAADTSFLARMWCVHHLRHADAFDSDIYDRLIALTFDPEEPPANRMSAVRTLLIVAATDSPLHARLLNLVLDPLADDEIRNVVRRWLTTLKVPVPGLVEAHRKIAMDPGESVWLRIRCAMRLGDHFVMDATLRASFLETATDRRAEEASRIVAIAALGTEVQENRSVFLALRSFVVDRSESRPVRIAAARTFHWGILSHLTGEEYDVTRDFWLAIIDDPSETDELKELLIRPISNFAESDQRVKETLVRCLSFRADPLNHCFVAVAALARLFPREPQVRDAFERALADETAPARLRQSLLRTLLSWASGMDAPADYHEFLEGAFDEHSDAAAFLSRSLMRGGCWPPTMARYIAGRLVDNPAPDRLDELDALATAAQLGPLPPWPLRELG